MRLTSSLLSLVVGVEIVERCCGSFDAGFIVRVAHGDAGDEEAEARRLRTIERALLQIDVVNDFADRAQRTIVRNEARGHHLERAAVPDVRELAAHHVETNLARARPVVPRGDESNL